MKANKESNRKTFDSLFSTFNLEDNFTVMSISCHKVSKEHLPSTFSRAEE